MRILTALLFALVLISLTIAGCSEEKPPEIQLGVDKCDMCGMIISEKNYAGLYYSTAEKRWKKFDDLGCLVMEAKKEGDAKPGTIYVFDYETEELIKAEKAYYVVSSEIWTPMNTGIVAFKSKEKAEETAKKHRGKVMSFEELMKMEMKMGGMGGMKSERTPMSHTEK